MLPSVIGTIGSSKQSIGEPRFLIKNNSIVSNLAQATAAGSASINRASRRNAPAARSNPGPHPHPPHPGPGSLHDFLNAPFFEDRAART
jgi:hypothetical protein